MKAIEEGSLLFVRTESQTVHFANGMQLFEALLYASPSNAFKNGTYHFRKVSKWHTLLRCDRSGRPVLTNGFQALEQYFPVMLYLVLYKMVLLMVVLIIVLLFFKWCCYDCVLGGPNFQV